MQAVVVVQVYQLAQQVVQVEVPLAELVLHQVLLQLMAVQILALAVAVAIPPVMAAQVAQVKLF
jgi:hypothetical protein